MSDILTFDEATHTYRVGGQVRPSVTQLLNRLHDFAGVPLEVLAAASERGTNVHAICQYHDENDLDLSSVAPQYMGYLQAWMTFCADFKVKWSHIEHRGFSKRYGYAGTPDRRGWLGAGPKPGFYGSVDIKTGLQPHECWGIQAAAYRQLAAEESAEWLLSRRATVQLRADGTYKFLAWDDPDDWAVFLSLITLTNWSSKHGKFH